MANYQIDFQKIKAEVSIGRALAMLGETAELKPTGKGGEMATACPLPGCDGKKSFKFNPDKGVFRCFKCERGGDVIKLVELAEGVTPFAAAKRLAKFAGILANRATGESKVEPRSIEEILEFLLDIEATVDLFEGLKFTDFGGMGFGDHFIAMYVDPLRMAAAVLAWVTKRSPEEIANLERLVAQAKAGFPLLQSMQETPDTKT